MTLYSALFSSLSHFLSVSPSHIRSMKRFPKISLVMFSLTCFLSVPTRRKVRSVAQSHAAAATAAAVGTSGGASSSDPTSRVPSSTSQAASSLSTTKRQPRRVQDSAKMCTTKPAGATVSPTAVSSSKASAASPPGVGLRRESVARLVREATRDVEAAAAAATSGVPSADTTNRAAGGSSEKAKDDAFMQLLDSFRISTAPLSDLDEVLGAGGSGSARGVAGDSASLANEGEEDDKLAEDGDVSACSAVRKRASSVITCRDLNASLICPKKFYLMSARPDLEPGSSIGEAVHLDDGVGFNELARRWDRLQFGSKAILISETDHDAAVQKTERVVIDYFTNQYATFGEQAPTLTLHRAAFSAPLQAPGQPKGSPSSILRARPCVVRYRPKDNQWVILESQAILDPLTTSLRASLILQRLHFTMFTLRRGLSQPHIPIAVRKRFLDVDPKMLTEESLNKGKNLFDGAHPVAPIDVKRSGLLHIRQFLPGPVTLMDCEPTQLVKFIQRVSLEELLEADQRAFEKANGGGQKGGRGRGGAGYHSSACSGAFDLQQVSNLDPAVTPFYNGMVAAMKLCGRHSNARSSRSLRARESEASQLFESQQQLLEAILLHHTLKIVARSRDVRQITRWTTFSKDTAAGLVTSTWDSRDDQSSASAEEDAETAHGDLAPTSAKPGKRRGKSAAAQSAVPALPVVPCFSENIGGHCSRGDTCPFFAEGFCLPQRYPNPVQAQDNHLFTMPSTAVAKKSGWWIDGARTVRDVLHCHATGSLKLTAPQLRYARAVAQGEVAVCPKEVDKFFEKIQYPLFVIDFEAVQFALPPFEKVVAYQSVPFQFSLDVFQHDVLTETPTHYDYLHFGPGYSPNVDPRPACVKELLRIVRHEREKKRQEMLASGQLDDLKREEEAAAEEAAAAAKSGKNKRGPRKTTKAAATNSRTGRGTGVEAPLNPWDGTFLAHFASFEKSCLEKLGQLEDEFKEEIRGFYFLDTLDLLKKGFLHPNANGSNSLKKLLPAICPDFQYGVFGVEGSSDGSGADDGGGEEGSQSDEQKGENAMAVYRMWYHQEGGGTLQDLQRATGRTVVGENGKTSSSPPAVLPALPSMRDKVWARLRIQLLEYCSLDTRALYEIMREVHREREAVKDMTPEDKSGWVFTKPLPREINF